MGWGIGGVGGEGWGSVGRRMRPTAALSPNAEKHEPAGTRKVSARSKTVKVYGNNVQG